MEQGLRRRGAPQKPVAEGGWHQGDDKEDECDVGSDADERCATRGEPVAQGGAPAPDAGRSPEPEPAAQPTGIAAGGLTVELARRIVADLPSCRAGQFLATRLSERRFVTCLGVHRSMALFACAPGKDPKGFAAHVSVGAIRFSMEQRAAFLPEVVSAMCKAFHGVRKDRVIIHIVGDLVGEPLQRYLPELPNFAHCCSLHLEAALRKAGFEGIEKGLCAAFEEEESTAAAATAEEPPPRPLACATGAKRRFSLAALDLRTGQVLVQSAGTQEDTKAAIPEQWEALEEEYERDKAELRARQSFAPMLDARGSRDFWALYYEAVAHPLSALLALLAIVAALIYLGPLLMPQQDDAPPRLHQGQRRPKR